MSSILDALIVLSSCIHVLLAPFTKVEESFNLHATHDVLMYGVSPSTLQYYDHFTFPGAVPRTFVGPILLAWLSTPFIYVVTWVRPIQSKFEVQIIVRLVLASVNALGLCLIQRACSRRFGRTTGLFFTFLTCTQFHLPFWMGRTVPNMFALFPVSVAVYFLLHRAPNAKNPSSRKLEAALALLTFTVVVFRAEVVLFLGPIALQALYLRQITFLRLLTVGLWSGLASLALTVAIDTYFWSSSTPLWPEFSGIWFNVVQGKSAEWGTSPIHAYLSTHLPKLLLGALPLSIIGTIADPRIRTLLIPALAFVLLISCLGHKEWRFVVYVVPMFNVAAGRGARWMVSRRKNSIFGRILFFGACGLVFGNMVVTALSMRASMANYPGGEAMSLLHTLYTPTRTPPPHVHISNLAAQTGASLFTQLNAPPHFFPGPHPLPQWTYNKTEGLSPSALASSPFFTHVISEIPPVDGTWPPSAGGWGSAAAARSWRVSGSVKGFERWAVDWDLLKGKRKGDLLAGAQEVLRCVEGEKLWILERV